MTKQPVRKIERVLSSGKTAAKAGGKMLYYFAKQPFMDAEKRREEKNKAIREGAQTLFQGLSLLKGTALKLAQQLSLETDLLPEAAVKELVKSYHQVPPINRALVRKAIIDGLGQPPEKIFSNFDLTAFAAASLGQVHSAESQTNHPLAVKIQYPGIAATIDSDMALLRQVLRPVIQSDQLVPLLTEVTDRLHEEIDYQKEAERLVYFGSHLKIDGVRVPDFWPDFSTSRILTTTIMPGKPLNQWLMDCPDQRKRDAVAQRLQDIFITGLYDLHLIHADPNPGNFIIAADLTIGLVDFGCMKSFEPSFVQHYQRLAQASFRYDYKICLQEMIALGFIPKHIDSTILARVKKVSDASMQWLSKLCEHEYFDFADNPNFIGEGMTLMRQYHDLHRHLQLNPDILFLDRTRYGLLRLFEKMGARVCFRNAREWKR